MSDALPALPSLSPDLVNIILQGPAAAAPPGETTDFDTTDTLHPAIIASIVLGIIFSTLVVAARLYTKLVVMRSSGWDDFFVFAAWAMFIAYCALCAVVYPYGGIHIWNRRVSDVIFVLRYGNYIEILYSPMIIFVKLSILLQYNRIFVPTFRATPITWLAIWATIVLNLLFYIIIFFFVVFQCSPREAIWNVFVHGQCYDITKLLITVAAFNLASDIIILLIPQHAIWKLQMNRRRKIGLSAVFGVGVLVIIITALRVQSTVRLIDTKDVTWYLAPTAMWTLAEVSLALIASCLPTMPRFFQAMRGQISRVTPYYGSRSDPFKSTVTSDFKEKPVYGEPNRFERDYRQEDRIEPAQRQARRPPSPLPMQHPPRSRDWGETWFREEDDGDTIDGTDAGTDTYTQNDWILPPTPPEDEEPHRLSSVPYRATSALSVPPRVEPSRSLDETRPAHPIIGRIVPTRSMDFPRPALQPQEAQARAAGLAAPAGRQPLRPLAVAFKPESESEWVSDRSTVLSQSLPASRHGEREDIRLSRSQPGSRPSEPQEPISPLAPRPPPKDPAYQPLGRHNTVPARGTPPRSRGTDADNDSQLARSRSARASGGPRHIAQLYNPDAD